MALRDWEKQQALLHKHGNVRFVRPTPRGHEQPVFVRYRSNPGVDLFIVIACAVVLALAVLALAKGWL